MSLNTRENVQDFGCLSLPHVGRRFGLVEQNNLLVRVWITGSEVICVSLRNKGAELVKAHPVAMRAGSTVSGPHVAAFLGILQQRDVIGRFRTP